jgi:hypothetical protein
MANPVTLEDIYKLFERSQAEADRRFVEADRRTAAADRQAAQSRADFERGLAESRADFERGLARSRADFERDLADFRAEFKHSLDESQAAFDQRMAETERIAAESRAAFDQRMAKSEAIAAQANQAVNNLSSRWGRFVENMVAPATVRLFQEKGIAVKEIHQRLRARRGDLNLEVDILAVDDTVAVVVEVKSRLTQKHIEQFINNLALFKQGFPAYQGYQVYGAVAAIEADRGADRYAYKQGLFLIRQSGETVEIDNDAAFKPTVW